MNKIVAERLFNISLFLSIFTICASIPSLVHLTYYNLFIQLFLFGIIACIPASLSGKMSYVDIAWPWGLVSMGLLVLYFGEFGPRLLLASSLYLLVGGRMALIGLLMLVKWGPIKKELTRYQYQRILWNKAGLKNEQLSLQSDIMAQCLANGSFLFLPLLLQQNATGLGLGLWEAVGYTVSLCALIFEHIADSQKKNFLHRARKIQKKDAVCNVGLWKYCRHPNYFGEWMVWNGLVIASIPSWVYLYQIVSIYLFLGLGLALLYTSFGMYRTLVLLTGAVPSEYYSLRNRPGYRSYQERTNMFFPGLPKRIA